MILYDFPADVQQCWALSPVTAWTAFFQKSPSWLGSLSLFIFTLYLITSHSRVCMLEQSFYLGVICHHHEAPCGLKDQINFSKCNGHQGWESSVID